MSLKFSWLSKANNSIFLASVLARERKITMPSGMPIYPYKDIAPILIRILSENHTLGISGLSLCIDVPFFPMHMLMTQCIRIRLAKPAILGFIISLRHASERGSLACGMNGAHHKRIASSEYNMLNRIMSKHYVAHKFRLKPTKEQAHVLESWCQIQWEKNSVKIPCFG